MAGHALTSGQIPRLMDFEKPPAAAGLVAGPMDSACAASLHFPPGTLKVEAKPGELIADIFQAEIATAYHIKDRGLVVITSCGHAGVINSVRQVEDNRHRQGARRGRRVPSGPAPDEIVAKTVEAFKAIDPDYIIPMHCTGTEHDLRCSTRDAQNTCHAIDRHSRDLRELRGRGADSLVGSVPDAIGTANPAGGTGSQPVRVSVNDDVASFEMPLQSLFLRSDRSKDMELAHRRAPLGRLRMSASPSSSRRSSPLSATRRFGNRPSRACGGRTRPRSYGIRTG